MGQAVEMKTARSQYPNNSTITPPPMVESIEYGQSNMAESQMVTVPTSGVGDRIRRSVQLSHNPFQSTQNIER